MFKIVVTFLIVLSVVSTAFSASEKVVNMKATVVAIEKVEDGIEYLECLSNSLTTGVHAECSCDSNTCREIILSTDLNGYFLHVLDQLKATKASLESDIKNMSDKK